MRYMGKASIWKSKALGRFVSMLGAFPVHRGTADRESLRTCLEVIENGEPLVMFPEGTRRSGDTVEDLFDGPAYVAARAGVPLVPVGIGGSDEAMPVGAKFIKPHKIVLVVGPPIHPPAGDGTGRVKRRVVRELTAQLQAEVQRLYDEARRPGGLSRPAASGLGRGIGLAADQPWSMIPSTTAAIDATPPTAPGRGDHGPRPHAGVDGGGHARHRDDQDLHEQRDLPLGVEVADRGAPPGSRRPWPPGRRTPARRCG